MAQNKQELPVAVVVGVGPGLGASLARRFSKGYAVAVLARRADYLNELAKQLDSQGGRVTAIPLDVSDPQQIASAFASVKERLGSCEVLLYNAGSAAFGNVMEISPEQFENAWRVNALGAFLCVKQVVEAMVSRRRGVLLFTGATAGVKAGPRSAAFGAAKFAQRGFAQSLARDLGPKGIHVAWVNIDGGIDIPGRHRPGLQAEDMLKPDAVAETYWNIAHQDPSAWTMELELRPFKEKF